MAEFSVLTKYETWAQELAAAADNYRKSMWQIGDLLVHGESAFGEKYVQAASDTGLAPSTLKNAFWVAKAIPVESRNMDLSFSLHMEVAKLETEQQKKVLKLAADLEWASKEVRCRVKAAMSGDEKALMPEWVPLPTLPPASAAPPGPPPVEAEPNTTPETGGTPITKPDNRAEYIFFHVSELKTLVSSTTPSIIFNDLDLEKRNQLVSEAEDVIFFLGGLARLE